MVQDAVQYQGNPKPKQKIPNSQKDKDWAEASGQFFRTACQPAVDKAEALKLYRLANGQLDESDYLYVTNPINTPRQELQGYPARLVNYDIISPNVNLVLGEKAKRFFPPIVIAKNSDYHSVALEQEQKMYVQELQKMFINELVAMKVPLDKETTSKSLDQIQKEIKNLPDELSIQAQNTLDYIITLNDLPRHLRMGFYDWCCLAMVYSYKDVHKNKTYYEIMSSIHMNYLCAPQHHFIEDGDAVRARHIFSVNEVYDRFQDDPEFSDELEEFVAQYGNQSSFGFQNSYGYGYSDLDVASRQREMFRNLFGYLPEEKYAHGVQVDHVQWRSFTKIGKLVSYDLFGNKMITEVSDDFKPFPEDDITWTWVDEIWEGYCIGDKYWIGLKPIPIQRGSYNDPHKAKLLYNGRNYFARHTRPTSLVKKGESYQKSVNIIKYRAEETLAKNLDKVILFPLGLIPKKEGWDEAKMMYYLRAFGFLFFDDTRPNVAQIISALKELNLSSYQHLMECYQLVQTIKMEWDSVCGITPQRKGQVAADAGKGVTNNAVSYSYTMSEELFLEFEEFEQREYTGMAELGKFAFVDGIQSHFIRQDGTRAFLNLKDPSSYINSDLALFVKNGGREYSKLEELRAQTQAFAQNNVDPKMITGIIEADNFGKLHKIMDEIDERNQEKIQQEQQMQRDLQASKERISEAESSFNYYDADLKSNTAIQVALIKQGMELAGEMQQAEQSGDTSKFNEVRNDFEKNSIELLKIAQKNNEILSKERMNKLDNKTALQNKVSGEK